MTGAPRYWFPAKRYGWGWGLPSSWQGWVVLGVYIALLGLSRWFFPSPPELPLFIGCAVVLTGLLVVVCWITGEPPKWRGGDR